MITVVTPEVLELLIIPSLLKLSTDKIPNIRFNVAKTITALLPLVEMRNDVIINLKPCLNQLATDQDMDVQFFSQKGLAILV